MVSNGSMVTKDSILPLSMTSEQGTALSISSSACSTWISYACLRKEHLHGGTPAWFSSRVLVSQIWSLSTTKMDKCLRTLIKSTVVATRSVDGAKSLTVGSSSRAPRCTSDRFSCFLYLLYPYRAAGLRPAVRGIPGGAAAHPQTPAAKAPGIMLQCCKVMGNSGPITLQQVSTSLTFEWKQSIFTIICLTMNLLFILRESILILNKYFAKTTTIVLLICYVHFLLIAGIAGSLLT